MNKGNLMILAFQFLLITNILLDVNKRVEAFSDRHIFNLSTGEIEKSAFNRQIKIVVLSTVRIRRQGPKKKQQLAIIKKIK